MPLWLHDGSRLLVRWNPTFIQMEHFASTTDRSSQGSLKLPPPDDTAAFNVMSSDWTLSSPEVLKASLSVASSDAPNCIVPLTAALDAEDASGRLLYKHTHVESPRVMNILGELGNKSQD